VTTVILIIIGLAGWFMYFAGKKSLPKPSELEKKLGDKLCVHDALGRDIEALQRLVDINKDIEAKSEKADTLKEELIKQDEA
jgi:hypothetical protein